MKEGNNKIKPRFTGFPWKSEGVKGGRLGEQKRHSFCSTEFGSLFFSQLPFL